MALPRAFNLTTYSEERRPWRKLAPGLSHLMVRLVRDTAFEILFFRIYNVRNNLEHNDVSNLDIDTTSANRL
jgi:hypothetical protein